MTDDMSTVPTRFAKALMSQVATATRDNPADIARGDLLCTRGDLLHSRGDLLMSSKDVMVRSRGDLIATP